MMTGKFPRKATKAELAYIRDMERTSVFDLLDQGKAKILSPEEYPEPLKRFLAHEEKTLHLELGKSLKQRLKTRSRETGVPVERLARRWIQQGLKRGAG